MSLPSSQPAQRSITSFFQSKTPKYAPPPPPPPPQTNPQATSSSLAAPPADPQRIPALPTTLPPEASIRLPTAADVNPLRRINALLLPVAYQDDFYNRLVDYTDQGATSRVITWAQDGGEPKVVGGVVCRIEPQQQQGTSTLYIRSLCILAPYRSMGLVGAAVDNIIAGATSDDVKTVTAHVWTENDEAIRWYEARGFTRDTHPIEGYYRKLRPGSAWLMQRDVASKSSTTTSTPPTSRTVNPSPTAAVVNLPPMKGGPPRPAPARVGSGLSFQNQRPETEWNDLPPDMAGGPLAPPKKGGSGSGSEASSRSSSAMRKKRDRSYPAAAFGGNA